jgi:hypothetical protein
VAATLEAAARPGDPVTCQQMLAPLAREISRAAEDIGV